MAKENSILEEAIIQMKNLEEAVAENAKGILESTMTQEIKELVKESLSEQEDDEIETDDMEVDNIDDVEDEMDDETEMDVDMDMDAFDMEEPDMELDFDDTIDLTDKPASDVLKVYKLMTPDDEVVVVKDSANNINIKDNETDKEYMIVGESMDEDFYMDDEIEMSEDDDDYFEFDFEMGDDDDDEFEMDDEDEDEFDFEMDDEDEFEMDDEDDDEFEMDDEDEDEFDFEMDDEEMGEEVVFEIEFDDEEEIEEEDDLMESFKAKGKGMGKPKFSYDKKPNQDLKFPKQKEGTKGVGMGKGPKKDVYKKESPSFDGEFKKKPKKAETKEASRTLGNGKAWGKKGLPKPRTSPKHLKLESADIKELEMLREKNEEYRKALNIFKDKINEVAVFNSNLAYATRLFTEHSTSKQEKLNILQRFDGVTSIKESKNLYKVIKDELSNTKTSNITESVEQTILKTPTTGSAINLIESKTYENPQFLRMKDLMSKLK